MGGVKVQSHNVCLTSYRLTSLWFYENRPSLWFYENRPSHPWDAVFSKLGIEKNLEKNLKKSQSHSSRSHSRYNTISTRIPFVPCRSVLPFLWYNYYKIWRWKFKVKVMGEVKVESHKMGPTFSRLTSLSSNGPPIPEIQHFQNLTLKIQGQC